MYHFDYENVTEKFGTWMNLPIELSIFDFVYFTIIDTYMYFVGQTQENLATYVLLKTYPDLT